jgi:hypothetical protein
MRFVTCVKSRPADTAADRGGGTSDGAGARRGCAARDGTTRRECRPAPRTHRAGERATPTRTPRVGALLRVRHASRVLTDVQLDAGLRLERLAGRLFFGPTPAPGTVLVPRALYVPASDALALPHP